MTSAAHGAASADLIGSGGRSDFGAVRAWLILLALLVFAIVVVGGATRLTESGLSITEWELVTGVLPPLTEAQWLVEFEKYRRIPQYQQVNRGMSLGDFQVIYYWEWAHRLLGRVIGLVWIVGFVALLATRRIGGRTAWLAFGIGCLIGLQGAIGWWMVTSGLTQDRIAVAPYRLATHLTLACVIFAALVWAIRDLTPRAVVAQAVPPVMRHLALILLAGLFLQIFAGALVAGARAGYVYQTWPLIDGGLWPSGMGAMSPWWKNLFENTATVQFVHRMIAYLLLAIAVFAVWRAGRADVPALVRSRAWLILAAFGFQAVLGVATLLTGMNIAVALGHQAWIVPVIAIVVVNAHALTARAEAVAVRA